MLESDKSLHMDNSQHLIITLQNVPSVPIGPNFLFSDQTTELIPSRLLSKPCKSNSQQGTAQIGVYNHKANTHTLLTF